MTLHKFRSLVILLALLATLAASLVVFAIPVPMSAVQATHRDARPLSSTQAVIIDHTNTDLSVIPEFWTEQAKKQLRVSYGHTSHGSQPISGMGVLRDDASYGDLYDFTTNGAVAPGVLSIADRTPSGDLGNPDRVTWEARTREYLNGVGSERNVVIWSWCGQVSSATEAEIETYLSLMQGLERDYPNITFVYMTGHLDGKGIDGNLHQRNNQIREFCKTNNKVLFDFADIESYDPDGEYYVDLAADDGCNYDSDGNGSRDSNWAVDWCATRPGDPMCASCSCAHSQPLNCNLKARAFWWMMARLAGWEGPASGQPALTPSYKSVSSPFADYGETITYTVVIRSGTGPLTSTILFSDTVREGLSYVPGTLIATAGTADDGLAPTLTWSGVLTPTPAVTVTYAATVTYAPSVLPQVFTNTAVIALPGHEVVTRTATLRTNWLGLYLPVVVRTSH